MSNRKVALTLKQFMVRQEVLKQYRHFFRTIQKLEDQKQKSEIADWVRTDFQKNKNIQNSEEDRIKALLIYGDRMLKELKQTIDMTKSSPSN